MMFPLLGIAFFLGITVLTSAFATRLPSTQQSRIFTFPLAATECRDGSLEVIRIFEPEGVTETFDLDYKVFRPMSLSSQKACPILVLHGGPSVPSNYLQPLVDFVPYRSIVFYDQLGCGQSDEPADVRAYSIEKGIDDLEMLIKKVGLRKFHLLGHSFGGILGYEFLKRLAERNEDDPAIEVLSFTIASTPTSVPLVEFEVQELLEKLMEQEDVDEATVEERFQQEHICRTPEKPQALVDAYNYAGTVWRGTQAISNYAASPPSDSAAPLPPAMVLRGEHDFVTRSCIQDWKEKLWNHKRIREKEVPGCSHHALLENGILYGDIIESYCAEYDP